MKKSVKKKKNSPKTAKSGDPLLLKEQVRALKRKLWVAERMRVEAVTKTPSQPRREAWDGKLLAAGVAHEFNNILGAADGHAEWALQTRSPEDMREALLVVRQACRRSLQITKSLQGLPSLREEEANVFALSKLGRELRRHFSVLSKKTGVSLRIDLPDVELYGNEAQLFEVLVNLVKNSFEALQASATQDACVEFTGRTTANTQVKLLVSDNGPGIPAALRERVFHPFFTTKGRLKSMITNTEEEAPSKMPSSPSDGGSGLGLFLSRSIIQNMGGRLEHLESTRGTRFQLSLPLASKPRRLKTGTKS